MRVILTLMAAALAATAAAPTRAIPGGELSSLPLGAYHCELPGDAAGPWRIRQPEEDFTILRGSNYRANGKRGSYLLTGDRLTMTSGPFRDKRYHRQSHGFLRLIGDDGEPSALRCVLSTRNVS